MAAKKAKTPAYVKPVTTGVGVVCDGVQGIVISVADEDKNGNALEVVFEPRNPNIERQVVKWADCEYLSDGLTGIR